VCLKDLPENKFLVFWKCQFVVWLNEPLWTVCVNCKLINCLLENFVEINYNIPKLWSASYVSIYWHNMSLVRHLNNFSIRDSVSCIYFVFTIFSICLKCREVSRMIWILIYIKLTAILLRFSKNAKLVTWSKS
jgi:hypothetical protein